MAKPEINTKDIVSSDMKSTFWGNLTEYIPQSVWNDVDDPRIFRYFLPNDNRYLCRKWGAYHKLNDYNSRRLKQVVYTKQFVHALNCERGQCEHRKLIASCCVCEHGFCSEHESYGCLQRFMASIGRPIVYGGNKWRLRGEGDDEILQSWIMQLVSFHGCR